MISIIHDDVCGVTVTVIKVITCRREMTVIALFAIDSTCGRPQCSGFLFINLFVLNLSSET